MIGRVVKDDMPVDWAIQPIVLKPVALWKSTVWLQWMHNDLIERQIIFKIFGFQYLYLTTEINNWLLRQTLPW